MGFEWTIFFNLHLNALFLVSLTFLSCTGGIGDDESRRQYSKSLYCHYQGTGVSVRAADFFFFFVYLCLIKLDLFFCV